MFYGTEIYFNFTNSYCAYYNKSIHYRKFFYRKKVHNMSEKDEKIIFARNLRQALESTGTSQQKLAEVVGVSEASLSFWLSADR